MTKRWEQLVKDGQSAASRQAYGEAEKFFQAAREEAEILGEEEPAQVRPVRVSLTLEHLADLHASMGRRASALKLYREVLSLRERHLGADHHKVAKTLFDLAGLCLSERQFEEAEGYYRRSVQVATVALGPRDPEVATIQHHLGTVLMLREKPEEAEEFLQQSLITRRQSEDAFGLAATLSMLAECEEARGRLAAARSYYDEVLQIKQTRLGPDHVGLIGTLRHLSRVAEELDDAGQAAERERQVLRIQENQLGQDHPSIPATLRTLARYEVMLEQWPEAAAHYQQLVDVPETLPDPSGAQRVEDAEYLLELYEYLKDHERAATLRKRVARLQKKYG